MTHRFQLRTHEIEAIQVTQEAALAHLMKEQSLPYGIRTSSASWNPKDRTVSATARFCIENRDGKSYINVGDWVLHDPRGFVVLSDKQFREAYCPIEEER